MSTNTAIEWADHTFNPWEGCQKVSPGCDHCYAEARNARFAGGTAINWGPNAPRRRTSASNRSLPKHWNAQADAFMAQHGRRQRVFCASLADVFDNAVDPAWRDDLWTLIRETPNLDWLLLTKRIGNVLGMLPMDFNPHTYPHVWLGATIVNQTEADRDIKKLLMVNARVRFLSMEPLLGQVDLTGEWLTAKLGAYPFKGLASEHRTRLVDLLDWVIVGGESGPGARPMHPDWARSLRDQCEAAGVPFLFKQWGDWATRGDITDKTNDTLYTEDGSKHRVKVAAVGINGWSYPALDHAPQGATMYRVGKKAAGRLLDGRTWDGFPS